MIRITPPGAGLVQRLRGRADRIAAARAAAVSRNLRRAPRSDPRSSGPDWRSATDLWPDFFNRD